MKFLKVLLGLFLMLFGLILIYIFVLAFLMGNTPDSGHTYSFWSLDRPYGFTMSSGMLTVLGVFLGITMIYIGAKFITS